MVNRGRSGGCATCKQRRVKCDETKPKCRSCQRLGFGCEYKTKYANLKFRDQNYRFHRTVATMPRSVAVPDTSVPFFLQHYASMGRQLSSARGFYEVLIPVYSSQSQNSALSLAVSALASKVLSLWRCDDSRLPRENYTRAVNRLRSTIQHRDECGNPATSLAILSLQIYENISSVYGLRPGTRVHYDGAVSLLPFIHSDSTNRVTNAYVRRFILHTEICSAMREERPLQESVRPWLEFKNRADAPQNLSSVLDNIGASVAELQARYVQLSRNDNIMPSFSDLREITTEAKCIEDRLLTWARNVPEHWHALKVTSGKDIDQSIPAYLSTCEIYSSCSVATLWNFWRVQRLLIVKIAIGSLNTISTRGTDCPGSNETLPVNDYFVGYINTFQSLMDSVCYSVPFYLGNRIRPLNITDFDDPEILFPSCDFFIHKGEGPFDEKITGPQSSRDEYRRHLHAQGPWHVLTPLIRLLTFFLDDCGQLLATFLRSGQIEWIREQLLRVTTLLHLPSQTGEFNEKLQLSNLLPQGSDGTRVERLAQDIRQGLTFMSGP
ncbi:C6 zinc finger domain protein [Penicillium angulare]|uniref:C6 zinc finger domain protein n=1 Tax=Penicillium angulare TaxID=116970 RepID=UPI00253FAD7C|nr:C6 zinc finger domain protein [Penicillium angulare]KAJ5261323.1 C6 zinc finger domain protein [Penicillium angulare]